jgi:hypothetical protein
MFRCVPRTRARPDHTEVQPAAIGCISVPIVPQDYLLRFAIACSSVRGDLKKPNPFPQGLRPEPPDGLGRVAHREIAGILGVLIGRPRRYYLVVQQEPRIAALLSPLSIRGTMRRVTVVLLAAFVAVFVTPTSAAGPIHIKLEPAAVSLVVTGACTFGVEFTDVRVHSNLLDFLDKAGEFKRTIIAGNFVVKATNRETGKSLTLNISGQFLITPNPDNSLTFNAHGRNLFFTVEPEPFVVFQRGRAVLTATVGGELLALVFNEVSGQSVDICQALAGPA